MLNRKLGLSMGMAVLMLGLIAAPAFADDMHIVCTGSTACSSGSTSLVTGNPNPTFDIVQVATGTKTGDMFLGVLVPNGTASVSISPGSLEESQTFTTGKLGALLGEGTKGYEFSSIASASAQVGVTATSFTAYEYDFGSVICPGGGGTCLSVSLDSVPKGTVIVAWQEVPEWTKKGTPVLDTYDTPLSESLTVAATPEPAAMVLMGTFLLAAFLAVGRKLTA